MFVLYTLQEFVQMAQAAGQKPRELNVAKKLDSRVRIHTVAQMTATSYSGWRLLGLCLRNKGRPS